MTTLIQLHQFWNSFQSKIAHDSLYITNIKGLRLQLSELQNNNKEVKMVRLDVAGFLKG